MLANTSESFGSYADRGFEPRTGATMPPPSYNYDSRSDGASFDQSFMQFSNFQSQIPFPHYAAGPQHQVPHFPESRYGPAMSQQLPLPKSFNTFGGVSAPLLPPIRAVDGSQADFQATVPRSRPAAKTPAAAEEKIGGVTAHLDYEMDEMVDFVTDMAQAMYGLYLSKICLEDIDLSQSVLNSRSSIYPTLRKFVLQVLTSTRLPSSTILLALHYLTVRLTILSARGSTDFSGSDVYNLLTTALLLGSKFLDDNTFQNRSWSDVSNIAVDRLNALESDWLRDIKWDMHFDPADPKGFELWRRRWQRHQATKMDSLAESMKLACLETNLRREACNRQVVSPNSAYPPSAYSASSNGSFYSDRSAGPWQAPRADRWTPPSTYSQYSPPSAPETGPATPDHFFGYPPGLGFNQFPAVYPSMKAPPPLHIVPSNTSVARSLNSYPPGLFPPYHSQGNQYAEVNNYFPTQYCMPPSHDHYPHPPRFSQAAAY